MATQKKQKADLISIYRLEFYKKQKNWKLSADARKQKEQQKSPHVAPAKNTIILNKTYNIESNIEDDPAVLNEAFVKDDSVASDGDVPISPVTLTSLHTQSLDPIHACQECQLAGNGPQSPWADCVDNPWTAGSDVGDKCSGDGNDGNGFDGWADGMVWTNSVMPQPGWDGDAAVTADPLEDVESPEELVRAAERELRRQGSPWCDERARLGGLRGEAARFMRGAHAAPHSSETELTADAQCEEPSALAAALRHHSGSLRRLLREAARRRQYRSTLSLDTCGPEYPERPRREYLSAAEHSYDAFPTRDLPHTPHHSGGGFIPPQTTNSYYDRSNPQFDTNISQYNEIINLYQRSDTFAPIHADLGTSRDQLSPIHRLEDDAASDSSWCQRGEAVPFCLANLYRDGFLAGSHRNKPSHLIGRGRGRMLDA